MPRTSNQQEQSMVKTEAQTHSSLEAEKQKHGHGHGNFSSKNCSINLFFHLIYLYFLRQAMRIFTRELHCKEKITRQTMPTVTVIHGICKGEEIGKGDKYIKKIHHQSLLSSQNEQSPCTICRCLPKSRNGPQFGTRRSTSSEPYQQRTPSSSSSQKMTRSRRSRAGLCTAATAARVRRRKDASRKKMPLSMMTPRRPTFDCL